MGFSFWRVPSVLALASLFAATGPVQAAGYLDPVVGNSVQGGETTNLHPFVSITPVVPGQRRPRPRR